MDHKVKAAAAANEEAWEGIGQSAGTTVWRIEQFKVVPWPKDQYGFFFRGDSYIVLHSYTVGGSDALKHDIHIWIGSESSQDEYGTAAYKMVEADDYLGGAPIQHRQVEGHESVEFAKIFEALEYLDGGVDTGFNKVEPTPDKPIFFHVKGTRAKTMKMSQVPMSVESMNEGDSFILYVSKALVWCWHGKDVSIDARLVNSRRGLASYSRRHEMSDGRRTSYWLSIVRTFVSTCVVHAANEFFHLPIVMTINHFSANSTGATHGKGCCWLLGRPNVHSGFCHYP